MPSVSCCSRKLVIQWTCQLVVKTGTPLSGELMVLLQGGGNFVSGEFSTPTGSLDTLVDQPFVRPLHTTEFIPDY